MLLKHQVIKFFLENSIPLECEKLLPVTDFDALMLKADSFGGRSFSSFYLMAVANAERTGINPNFRSEDDLYECYTEFMVGYTRKNNANN